MTEWGWQNKAAAWGPNDLNTSVSTPFLSTEPRLKVWSPSLCLISISRKPAEKGKKRKYSTKADSSPGENNGKIVAMKNEEMYCYLQMSFLFAFKSFICSVSIICSFNAVYVRIWILLSSSTNYLLYLSWMKNWTWSCLKRADHVLAISTWGKTQKGKNYII